MVTLLDTPASHGAQSWQTPTRKTTRHCLFLTRSGQLSLATERAMSPCVWDVHSAAPQEARQLPRRCGRDHASLDRRCSVRLGSSLLGRRSGARGPDTGVTWDTPPLPGTQLLNEEEGTAVCKGPPPETSGLCLQSPGRGGTLPVPAHTCAQGHAHAHNTVHAHAHAHAVSSPVHPVIPRLPELRCHSDSAGTRHAPHISGMQG